MAKKNIIVTGGDGRFASELKKFKSKYNLIFLNKRKLDITSTKSIKKNIKIYKPKIIFHLAGLSRPMIKHEKDFLKSIELNIIGTCNIVRECAVNNIKLIYFSTNYVYPGKKGNYSENDSLKPWNNYGWSKLGGESAVQMYKNSLIIRCALTEYPFKHKKAFVDVQNNFIYHKDFIPILFKVISIKGVINIGGKNQSVFQFAKKNNPHVIKAYSSGQIPKRVDMNLKKLKTII